MCIAQQLKSQYKKRKNQQVQTNGQTSGDMKNNQSNFINLRRLNGKQKKIKKLMLATKLNYDY